jgi:hypothetical protein
MSATSSLIPSNKTYENEINLPTISGETKKDLKILYTLNKNELLALCEKDKYVFDLCNNDPFLYQKITAPSPLK